MYVYLIRKNKAILLICFISQNYFIVSELVLSILPTDTVSEVNLTNWVRNTTATDQVSDTISSYNGLVVRRLSEGTGLVVTMSTGIISLNTQ